VKLGYLIGVGVVIALAVVAFLMLHTAHEAPAQLGSPSGFEGFVPSGQINYNGNTDPTGDLILSNGTTIQNVIWNGPYASTIIQNHNQINQLNNQFVGQTDPVNGQPHVPLQDVYVVKGQVPIQQVTINGQPYYVIEADKINPANIAGFYTYQGWVPNFVAAMNTQGTIPARLPGNSPVYVWANLTGTVAYQTLQYEVYGGYPAGGYVLELSNKPIIPYGVTTGPLGISFSNFTAPSQVYNISS